MQFSRISNHTANALSIRVGTISHDTSFGSAISEMQFSSDTLGGYRYGFNGEEKMNELSGENMIYDLEARFYDSRIGKMFSLDPLMAGYAWQSPYAYMGNCPISIVDNLGLGDKPSPHVVKKGETLNGLAKENGTTPEKIKELNHQIDWNSPKRSGAKKDWLYINDEIVLPSTNTTTDNSATSSETKSDLNIDVALDVLYKEKDKLGCQTQFNSQCSTVCEQIGQLNELKLWMSLDIGNGQVLPPRNCYLDIWEKRQTSVDGIRYYVNCQGYLAGQAPTELVFWPATIMEGPFLLEAFSMIDRSSIALNLVNANKIYKFVNGVRDISHFSQHAAQIMKVLNRSSLNFKEYMLLANDVIKTGTYNAKMNAFIKVIPGTDKCYFVGMTNGLIDITTFHIKAISKIK